ncbi:MAG TPA: flagellar motor protein MotB [Candidatus Angelobacter sp.]|jgi:chemotaxis protein MotB
MSDSKRPIIVIKKKVSHGGHHGGAWKVAYADFVTAMMALFIVLWLMNTSQQVQKVIGGYFKDPTGTSKKVGTNQTGSGENFTITRDNMKVLKEQLQKTIKENVDLDKLKSQVEMTVTAEGLRVELLESSKATFFDTGSAQPTPKGKELLVLLAKELGALPNKISLEGHTDSVPYPGKNGYSNWELSADRANTARRIIQENGVREDQVSQVRGYADQRLRDPAHPEDSSNRRISMIVQYVMKDRDEDEKKGGAEGEGAKHEGSEAKEGEKKPEQTAEKHEPEPAKH